MTQDEFLEKYGNVKVKFVHYYKYSFTFKGDNITVGVGGSGDDIYKLDVNTEPIEIGALYPDWAEIDGKFYDWRY